MRFRMRWLSRWQRYQCAVGRCDINISALVSNIAVDVYTRRAWGKPTLWRRRMRRSFSFSRVGTGASCSPSDDESDERSNEASTSLTIDRRAFRTSWWAEDSVLCCVGDGFDREECTARRSAAKVRRGVGPFFRKQKKNREERGGAPCPLNKSQSILS
jgi:hypothetical protein